MVKSHACRKAGLAGAMLFAVCICIVSANAGTVTLWYSGDADGVNGAISQGNSSSAFQAMTYDDFTISTLGWNVQEIFANQAVSLGDENPPEAYWEIRSGVVSDGGTNVGGSGGTLVASGTSACSFTATGGSPTGFPEYLVNISGLNVTLAPGTYWLGVAPVDDGTGAYYAETTSGLNAIGPADNGNSFFDSYDLGYTFSSAIDDSGFPLGQGPVDFSMGVAGVVVPEPATWCYFGIGLAGLVAELRRRRNR